ncbi:hypothetical protein [Frankia sp. CiP1_Cm_nod1]
MPEALDVLVELVHDWRDRGRVTTTAGLKPGLQQRTAGAFSEQTLGFATFRDFVQAAAAAGRVGLHQMPSGHWMVLLPGESPDDVPTSSYSRSAAADIAEAGVRPASPRTALASTSRLRHEVWHCFVDWAPDQRRVWDRHSRRGVMYPVDADGRPAWESTPERFTKIPAADMSTQVGWMREWAAALPDEDARAALLASLDETAQRGRFRQELTHLGLVAAWRSELQRRILAHAVAWAHEQSVDVTDLLEPRARTASAPPASISKPAPAPGVSDDELAQLRALLHLVIDNMTLAELASLPVRAEHLLRVHA